MTTPASPPHPALSTRLCELTGVRYPIVQTGMGWVSDPVLTAATSEAGGLGILSAVLLDTAELRRQVRQVRDRTGRPFGVNLSATHPEIDERVRILIDEGVRVASFALAPKAEVIARLKDAGLVVMPSVGARRHAEKVAGWGADAVLVQGSEGGGHTGPVPTSLLLPEVVDAVDIPVVAAGGFFDGRGLVAALAYGASGVAMGTRFLLTRESPVADEVKRVYLAAGVDGTVVTDQIDGVPQRILRHGALQRHAGRPAPLRLAGAARNALAFQRMSRTPWGQLVREGLAMRRARKLTWSQVVMAANAAMLYRAGLVEGRADVGIFASGQVVGVIDDLPSCAELVERIVRQAGDVLAVLGGEPR